MKNEQSFDVLNSAGKDWRLRFKQAQAHASRSKLNKVGAEKKPFLKFGVAGVPEIDRRRAHQVDPTSYLQARGFTVKRWASGSLSIRAGRDEQYRIDLADNGDWVHCDNLGNVGGDNITLVRTIEPGTSYHDAVYRLIGAASGASDLPLRSIPAKAAKAAPTLPKQSSATTYYGRMYLQQRGIDLETLKDAEAQGVLAYDVGGVLFCGRDSDGKVRAITRRATTPEQTKQKSDYEGTKKDYPAILRGESLRLVIVEGGVDGLAVHAYARRAGTPKPTVIITGGSNVFSFLYSEHVRLIMSQAKSIMIFGENEKNERVQANTDGQRNELATEIKKISAKTVKIWPVPEGKDFADYNLLTLERSKHEASMQGQVCQSSTLPANRE